MFTDSSAFSSDLLDLCFYHEMVVPLLDCTASGPVDEAVAYLRERLAEHWNPSDDLLRRVCKETGAWDDLETVDRITLIDRAIFCSLPDEIEVWNRLCQWEYESERNSERRRSMLLDLAIKHDEA